jgi:hypothetical protein
VSLSVSSHRGSNHDRLILFGRRCVHNVVVLFPVLDMALQLKDDCVSEEVDSDTEMAFNHYRLAQRSRPHDRIHESTENTALVPFGPLIREKIQQRRKESSVDGGA